MDYKQVRIQWQQFTNLRVVAPSFQPPAQTLLLLELIQDPVSDTTDGASHVDTVRHPGRCRNHF